MVTRPDRRVLTLRLKEIEGGLAPLVRLRGEARRAKRTQIRNKQWAAARARRELAERAAAVRPRQKRGAAHLEGAADARPAKRCAGAPGASEPARPAPPAGSSEWLRATVEAGGSRHGVSRGEGRMGRPAPPTGQRLARSKAPLGRLAQRRVHRRNGAADWRHGPVPCDSAALGRGGQSRRGSRSRQAEQLGAAKTRDGQGCRQARGALRRVETRSGDLFPVQLSTARGPRCPSVSTSGDVGGARSGPPPQGKYG